MSARIAIVCGAWPPLKCGVGDFSCRLAVELVRLGREVAVITDRSGRGHGAHGVGVRPVIAAWTPPAIGRILAELRRIGPDVVSLQYPTEPYGRIAAVDLVPVAVRLALRRPVVTTVHEYTTYRRTGRLRVRLLARASNAVIVPDPGNLEALAADIPGLRRRLHMVPLGPGIEPDLPAGFDRDAWRADRGAGRETLVLAYFGFISPTKGVDTLLSALDALPTDRRDIRLWLLADREPGHPRYARYHAGVAAHLAASRHAGRVIWTDYLPAAEISQYLAASDLAVLPYTDGATLRRTTLMAAIAHGLPVLSTGDRPPCPGVAVVPIGDAAALAQAITRLDRDRPALARLASEARCTAATYNWSVIARRTAEVLESVAE